MATQTRSRKPDTFPQHGARNVLSIDTPDNPSARVASVVEPSAELLDRALVGWELFLGSPSG